MERSEVLAIDERRYLAWRETAKGIKVTAEQLAAPEAVTRLIPARRTVGSVAVVNLTGFLTQKPSIFTLLFGGTSVMAFAHEVVAAAKDPSIGAVVIAADSPGGEVFGVPEAAAILRAVRGAKPLIGVADPLAASAAYWLLSQADEVVSTPSGLTGSIGAMLAHVDESAALEQAGIKVELITSSRRKAEGASTRPLDDESRAALQGMVDHFGALFEADVARGRKVSVSKVASDFGEGSIMVAEAAKAAGLIDRIATLEEVVAKAADGYKPQGKAARAYDGAELRLRARVAGLKMRS